MRPQLEFMILPDVNCWLKVFVLIDKHGCFQKLNFSLCQKWIYLPIWATNLLTFFAIESDLFYFFFKFYFWYVACTWKQLIPGVSLKSHPSSLKNCFSSDRIEERSIWIWCVNVWSDPTRDIACHPTWGQDTRKCTSPMGVEIIGIRYHFRASPPTWSSTGNLCIFQDAKISR